MTIRAAFAKPGYWPGGLPVPPVSNGEGLGAESLMGAGSWGGHDAITPGWFALQGERGWVPYEGGCTEP